jgi:hypothetical protein
VSLVVFPSADVGRALLPLLFPKYKSRQAKDATAERSLIWLEEFFGNETPSYAILSHTWGPEECTLQDLQDNEAGMV